MKKEIKILFHITAWFLLIAVISATLAFSFSETAEVVCTGIELKFKKDQPVSLTKQEILRMMNSADKNFQGKRLRDINSEVFEREIEKNSSVLKSDVYKLVVRDSTGYKGVLAVKIKYRTPAIRVMSSHGNFYMDEYGHRFPASLRYAANVLLITGNVNEDLAREKILPLALHIAKHDFWKAQIKQIHVNTNEELLLTPLVGDQIIEFGGTENYAEKFRNLLAFYEQVVSNENWDKYERINLKYTNQIIGKKRN
jgi:cell division protein FtsQ